MSNVSNPVVTPETEITRLIKASPFWSPEERKVLPQHMEDLNAFYESEDAKNLPLSCVIIMGAGVLSKGKNYSTSGVVTGQSFNTVIARLVFTVLVHENVEINRTGNGPWDTALDGIIAVIKALHYSPRVKDQILPWSHNFECKDFQIMEDDLHTYMMTVEVDNTL